MPAFIGIGSNIGDRVKNITMAIELIKQNKNIIVEKISSFYLTEPEGDSFTAPFVNCVIKISTKLTPIKLLEELENIEEKLGRKNKGKLQDRTIDLDILFFGNEQYSSERLTIPHPRAHLRRFVLIPMYEIAPEYVHPTCRKTIGSLIEKLTDNSVIIKLHK
jgi:2-amino-4-hydroxy-6-hydroxymethyldihydropteridine diphosphokinase